MGAWQWGAGAGGATRAHINGGGAECPRLRLISSPQGAGLFAMAADWCSMQLKKAVENIWLAWGWHRFLDRPLRGTQWPQAWPEC